MQPEISGESITLEPITLRTARFIGTLGSPRASPTGKAPEINVSISQTDALLLPDFFTRGLSRFLINLATLRTSDFLSSPEEKTSGKKKGGCAGTGFAARPQKP